MFKPKTSYICCQASMNLRLAFSTALEAAAQSQELAVAAQAARVAAGAERQRELGLDKGILLGIWNLVQGVRLPMNAHSALFKTIRACWGLLRSALALLGPSTWTSKVPTMMAFIPKQRVRGPLFWVLWRSRQPSAGVGLCGEGKLRGASGEEEERGVCRRLQKVYNGMAWGCMLGV